MCAVLFDARQDFLDVKCSAKFSNLTKSTTLLKAQWENFHTFRSYGLGKNPDFQRFSQKSWFSDILTHSALFNHIYLFYFQSNLNRSNVNTEQKSTTPTKYKNHPFESRLWAECLFFLLSPKKISKKEEEKCVEGFFFHWFQNIHWISCREREWNFYKLRKAWKKFARIINTFLSGFLECCRLW